jgi:hypothetical protein
MLTGCRFASCGLPPLVGELRAAAGCRVPSLGEHVLEARVGSQSLMRMIYQRHRLTAIPGLPSDEGNRCRSKGRCGQE